MPFFRKILIIDSAKHFDCTFIICASIISGGIIMENGNVEIFGEKVFNLPTMKPRLPKDIYKSLLKTINDGSKLDISVAEVVANAMKDWALENGCTHYTPLVPANDRSYSRKA